MNQPKPLPKVIRRIKYFISSIELIGLIENWLTVPLGMFGILNFKKGIILKLRNGLRFKARNFMDAWTIKEVFASNDYKINSSLHLASVIDIGANIGAFSILAASKMPNARIFSYEPGKEALSQFKENIALNEMGKRVFPEKMAVYKEKTKIKLYDSGRTGLASIYRTRKEKHLEIVGTITLEEIFIKNKILVCDYLKVDCEGAEYDILFSVPPHVLKKIRRISLEFHELNSKQNHHDLIKILKDNGFRVTHKYNDIENNIGYIYAKK